MCPGGGGTKCAFPARVPPIQFWLRRNSPGRLSGFDRVPLRSQGLLARLACSSDDQVARRRSRASQLSERLTWGFPVLDNPFAAMGLGDKRLNLPS